MISETRGKIFSSRRTVERIHRRMAETKSKGGGGLETLERKTSKTKSNEKILQ